MKTFHKCKSSDWLNSTFSKRSSTYSLQFFEQITPGEIEVRDVSWALLWSGAAFAQQNRNPLHWFCTSSYENPQEAGSKQNCLRAGRTLNPRQESSFHRELDRSKVASSPSSRPSIKLLQRATCDLKTFFRARIATSAISKHCQLLKLFQMLFQRFYYGLDSR